MLSKDKLKNTSTHAYTCMVIANKTSNYSNDNLEIMIKIEVLVIYIYLSKTF